MLKNAIIFQIMQHSRQLSKQECEEALQALQFVPTSGTQEKSVGFVPPRGHAHGELVEALGTNWFFRVAIETKKVPPSLVREKLDAKVVEIEEATGRKPGKKEKRDLSDDIFNALLPTAFPSRSDMNIWIDQQRKLLILDASSQSKADEVVSLLVKAIDLQLSLVQTTMSPLSVMKQWLMAEHLDTEGPKSFALGKELVLKADEEKAQVKYSHHLLDSEGIRPEIKKHIGQGKLPRSLELAHEQGLSFVLTETLTLKKLNFAGVEAPSGDEAHEDRFDADGYLATSILGAVLDDLFAELGGAAAHETQ